MRGASDELDGGSSVRTGRTRVRALDGEDGEDGERRDAASPAAAHALETQNPCTDCTTSRVAAPSHDSHDSIAQKRACSCSDFLKINLSLIQTCV